MGRAGTALKQVLENYGISQNRLAVAMGVGRSNVHRWVNGTTDPVAEAVLEIHRCSTANRSRSRSDICRAVFGKFPG